MLQGASKIKVYLKLINTYIKNVNYCKTHENRLYKLWKHNHYLRVVLMYINVFAPSRRKFCMPR